MCYLAVIVDIMLFFYIGEVIGRQHLIGYKIENCYGLHMLGTKHMEHLQIPTDADYHEIMMKQKK